MKRTDYDAPPGADRTMFTLPALVAGLLVWFFSMAIML